MESGEEETGSEAGNEERVEVPEDLRRALDKITEEDAAEAEARHRPKKRGRRAGRDRSKLWELPKPPGTVERWSARGDSNACPECDEVHRGLAGFWQHLICAHEMTLRDAGRWLHCVQCEARFAHESSWRAHLKTTNCASSSLQIHWREEAAASGHEQAESSLGAQSMNGGAGGEPSPKKKRFTTRSREGETEEQARERRQHCRLLNREYMQPRPGWVILRQAANFRCTVCGERDFPTIPSLVWHQRTEHSLQLSQLSLWIHCAACAQDFSSLSAVRAHLKEAKEHGCAWPTTLLSWQAEEGSEEARRDREGTAAPTAVGGRGGGEVPYPLASLAPGGTVVKLEPVDHEEEEYSLNTSCCGSEVGAAAAGVSPAAAGRRRRHAQRVDRSYMLPRPGHTIVRRARDIVCQRCGEGGFPTCSSLDHHFRKEHGAGVHQAGMWMHCARCGADFTSITSVRTHVRPPGEVAGQVVSDQEAAGQVVGGQEAAGRVKDVASEGGGGGGETTCTWPDVRMCWHERAQPGGQGEAPLPGVVKLEEEAEEGEGADRDQRSAEPAHGTLGASINELLQEINATPSSSSSSSFPSITRRFRKTTAPMTVPVPGYTLVRRHTDLPCFACSMRCASVTTFISHMHGKHRLYFNDIGAWLECACERLFTSTTALRTHIREAEEAREREGADGGRPPSSDRGGCSMQRVAVCWQRRVGGRHTQTPVWDGGAAAASEADADAAATPRQQQRLPLFYDAAPQLQQQSLAEGKREVKEEELSNDGDAYGEEEEWRETQGGAGMEEGEREKEATKGGVVQNSAPPQQGFDPTRFRDGDRFVLRKSAQLRCARCPEDSVEPFPSAAELCAHQEELHGETLASLQQWLECGGCCSVLAAGAAADTHAQLAEACTAADVRLCWMQLVESDE